MGAGTMNLKGAIAMKTPQHTYDRRHTAPIGRLATTSPQARSARDPRRPIVLTVAIILVAALIGGVSVFAWDRTGSRDPADALANAIEARDEALATAATLSDRVEGLRGQLLAADAQAEKLEGNVAASRAERLAMLGPALDDGRYFGALIAVGATQKPPRLVIDIEQWFTDDAARDAALEDGLPPWDAGTGGFYIRNENPRWRTIEIDPAAKVSVSTSVQYPTDRSVVSLSRFAELFRSYEGFLESSPYWITMRDGKVVAIEEQYIP
jgi:hypothetical protein